MDNSNKDFGTFEFISLKTNIWNHAYLNDYIRDISMKSSNSYVPPSLDLSWLNNYIKDIVDQSLKGHLNLYTNQQDITNTIPQIIEEQIKECRSNDDTQLETSHYDPPLEYPTIVESAIEEVPEAPFSTIQTQSIDSQIDAEKSDSIKNTPIKPYTRNIGVQPEIIQTHGMIIIRVGLPDGMNEKDLKISIDTDHAVIKWPSIYMEQLVPLPSDIVRNSAIAVIKDNILEIQISRIDNDNIREINIQV